VSGGLGSGITVSVRVTLDDYWRLSRVAERRGHDTIGHMLEAMLTRMAQVHDVDNELEVLVRAGLSDADIAEHLNLMLGTVADRRRRLKLPANRRHARATPPRERAAQ